MMTTKRCIECRREKPARAYDELRNQCRDCRRARSRRRYAEGLAMGLHHSEAKKRS